MLIGRSGQPERALKLGTAGYHLGWQKVLNWGKCEEGSAFRGLGSQYGPEVNALSVEVKAKLSHYSVMRPCASLQVYVPGVPGVLST